MNKISSEIPFSIKYWVLWRFRLNGQIYIWYQNLIFSKVMYSCAAIQIVWTILLSNDKIWDVEIHFLIFIWITIFLVTSSTRINFEVIARLFISQLIDFSTQFWKVFQRRAAVIPHFSRLWLNELTKIWSARFFPHGFSSSTVAQYNQSSQRVHIQHNQLNFT